MSRLYLRGSTWWAESYEQGKMVRWSLRTTSRAEAKRRLREYDSQPRLEPMPSRIKHLVTRDTAADDPLSWYRAYGTRRVDEAARQLRTLTRYFGGWALVDLDAGAILRYVAHGRVKGMAAATINWELATPRKALKVAHEYGKLDELPAIRMLKPAVPRSGFFERDQFEDVSRELPPDVKVAVLIAHTDGWRVASEVLPPEWRRLI
jgi:hypothetical protein